MTFIHKKEDTVRVASPGAEPASGQRESVASVLSRARERHGQNIRAVSQTLRIRQAYLEALESGESEKLPGMAYALGFLRTYADYLGLNADNIVDRFKEEVQATDRPTELIFPEPVIEGRIPGGAIILISIALLMTAYGGWFYLTNQGRSLADLVPALPEQIQALMDSEEVESAPAAPETPVAEAQAPTEPAEAVAEAAPQQAAAAPDPAPVEIEPQTRIEAAPAPEPEPAEAAATAATEAIAPEPQAPERIAAPAETARDVVQAQAETAPDAVSAPPSSPGSAPQLAALNRETEPVLNQVIEAQESNDSIHGQTVVIPAPPAAPQDFAQAGERAPQVYGEGNRGARIVLYALHDSWVQVRDNRDALLLTRVLRSGDVYRVPDQAGLTLLTGNAGGIFLEVDGVRLEPLGPIGAVRRQIALDPSLLLSGNTQ